MGCNPDKQDMETKQSGDLKDTPGAHFHGSWKIPEQTWSWDTDQENGEKESIGQTTPSNVSWRH